MGNMAGGYPIKYGGRVYPTSEHLFQILRLKDGNGGVIAKWLSIRNGMRMKKNHAKKWMDENPDQLKYLMQSNEDVEAMTLCVGLKLKQHPQLIYQLLMTGDLPIYEDVTSRAGVNSSALYWGAARIQSNNDLAVSYWVGMNKLGEIWEYWRGEYYSRILKELVYDSNSHDGLHTVTHSPTGTVYSIEPQLKARRISTMNTRIKLVEGVIEEICNKGTYFKVDYSI